MKKESSAGAIIFYQKDKKREYLLLNYLSGHWDFPKGHTELHESPLKTALREIKEETGLDVKILKGFERKVTYSFRHRGEFVIKDVIFYLAQSKTQRVKLSQEHKGYVWLPYEEAFNLITFNKEILKDAEDFLKRKSFSKGFTLIEILVVLVMILALFAITTQIFKPTLYLKKIRDNKRIADLKSIEIALKTYLNTTSFSNLGPTNKGTDEASSTIFISVPFDKENIRNLTIIWDSKIYYFSQVSSSDIFKNNGQGWIPVNISSLTYPPLFAYPYDPINSYQNKFFYSYVFKRASSTFEINANLEYEGFKNAGNEDKTSTDGGDNNNILEVGTDKTLMPNNLY